MISTVSRREESVAVAGTQTPDRPDLRAVTILTELPHIQVRSAVR